MTSAQVDDKPNSLAHDNKNWLRELRRARYTTSKTAQKIHNPSPRQPRMAVASRERPREHKNSAERGFLQGRNWHNRQRCDESAASHAETGATSENSAERVTISLKLYPRRAEREKR